MNAARAWDATERYLTLEEFGNVVRDPMYSPLLNFSEWEVRLLCSLVIISIKLAATSWFSCIVLLTRNSALELVSEVHFSTLQCVCISSSDFTNMILQMVSPMVFHGPGDKRGLQAVKVIFNSEDGEEMKRVYTFCLEKVCWLFLKQVIHFL